MVRPGGATDGITVMPSANVYASDAKQETAEVFSSGRDETSVF